MISGARDAICLVKACRPTWLSGKQLTGGCTFASACSGPSTASSKWSVHLLILHAGKAERKDVPMYEFVVWWLRNGLSGSLQTA